MLFKKENPINDRRLYDYYPSTFMMVLFGIYAFLSFYEAYITKLIGSVTIYLIFALIVLLLYKYKYIKVRYYHYCIIAWLAFKMLSALWVWNGYNKMISAQILGHIGMVALFCVLTVVNFEETAIRLILEFFKIASFSMSILTIFFSSGYVSGATGQAVESRVVLTLFGAQYDPNNMAAFYLFGISVALYFLLCERRQILFNLVVCVLNVFSLLQTSSRAGFLSLIAICILFAVSPLNKEEKAIDRFKRLGILLAGGVIVYFFVFRYVFPDALSRLLATSSYGDGSGRISIWNNALELFYANPFFGSGWGCYWGYNNYYHAVHNTYLQNLCDVGVFGTVLFMVPIVRIFVLSFKRKYYFPAIFVCAGLMPAFFLDSTNKRFFWNAIIFATMILNSNMKIIVAENERREKRKKKKSDKEAATCKYIKQR